MPAPAIPASVSGATNATPRRLRPNVDTSVSVAAPVATPVAGVSPPMPVPAITASASGATNAAPNTQSPRPRTHISTPASGTMFPNFLLKDSSPNNRWSIHDMKSCYSRIIAEEMGTILLID